MPLLKGNSKEIKKKNYVELMAGAMGDTRKKAISTIMRRRKVSFERARMEQAIAIIKNRS